MVCFCGVGVCLIVAVMLLSFFLLSFVSCWDAFFCFELLPTGVCEGHFVFPDSHQFVFPLPTGQSSMLYTLLYIV